MAIVAPSTTDVLHAYRHLYRAALHAVQYAKPSRYIARDDLRSAFRKGDPEAFSKDKIDRTVMFLNNAAKETGIEHRLVKNLLRVSYERKRHWRA